MVCSGRRASSYKLSMPASLSISFYKNMTNRRTTKLNLIMKISKHDFLDIKFKDKSIFSSFVLTNGGYGEGLNLQIKKTRGLGQKSE